MTHMCVDAVTRAAADLGYECAVAHDACAAFMAGLRFAYAKVASVS
jgi:nicotinamidase-related amidase